MLLLLAFFPFNRLCHDPLPESCHAGFCAGQVQLPRSLPLTWPLS